MNDQRFNCSVAPNGLSNILYIQLFCGFFPTLWNFSRLLCAHTDGLLSILWLCLITGICFVSENSLSQVTSELTIY